MAYPAMGQMPGLGATQDTGQDLLSAFIGRQHGSPLETLGSLRAINASNAPVYGSDSGPVSSGKKSAPSPADELDLPDVDSAMALGSQRALHASGKAEKETAAAAAGPLGFHPGLLDLAKEMTPTSQDKGYALAKAGFSMAEAAGHTGNFMTALAHGAGQGIDTLQQLRAQRAEMALKNAQLGSEDAYRQAESRRADAQAANFQRQSFAGNFPYVVMMAKKSGQPQQMMGPMGSPIYVMPDGSTRAGPTAQSDQGADLASPLMGGASSDTGSVMPGAAPATAPGAAPPPIANSPAAAPGARPLMPTQAPAPAGPQVGKPYLPPGVTQDMYDANAMMAEVPGPAGEAARKQASEWGQSNPTVKGQIAGAEAGARARYETVDVLDPSGNYVQTIPKDKWLAQQGKAGEAGGATPGGAPPPASLAGQAAPPHMMPKLNTETLGVQQVVPQAPEGGGFPPIPPNAKGLAPGMQKMQEQAAEVPQKWADNARSLDVAVTRLRSLAQMYKLTETNEWADAKEAVAANLKEVYHQLDLPFTVGVDTFGDPAAVQVAIKNATLAAFEQTRQYTNRITNMELQGQTKAVAMPDLQPAAAYNIIVNGIALAERDRQMMSGWNKAQKAGWKNPLAYENAWYGSNPADAWIQSTARRAGNLKGMPLPPKEDLNTKTTYVLRDGRLARWTGTGMVPVKKSYTDLAIPPPDESD